MKHCSAYSRRWQRAVTLSGIISAAIFQHYFLILGPPLPELYSHQFREERRIGILSAKELCLFSHSLFLSNKVSSIPLSRSLINFYLLNLTNQLLLFHPTHTQMLSEPQRSKITYSMSFRRFGVRFQLGFPNSMAYDECLVVPQFVSGQNMPLKMELLYYHQLDTCSNVF